MGLLKSQGSINDAIVSFNFEDPEDWTQRSRVAFGEVVYSEIEGGEEGVNYYTNLGRQQWGLMIDDFLYDDNDMTNGQKAKIALIDTASVGIMLPEFVWHGILVTMQHAALQKNNTYKVIQEKLEPQNVWEIRIPGHSCQEIWEELKPIEFKLENTTIVI